jgi:hypothetical protein
MEKLDSFVRLELLLTVPNVGKFPQSTAQLSILLFPNSAVNLPNNIVLSLMKSDSKSFKPG